MIGIEASASFRKKRQALRHDLQTWFTENGRDFPWRKTRDPFAILIAEVLLQRTLAPKVLLVYPKIIRRFGTARKCVAARPRTLAGLIRPLGLVRRAQVLRELAGALLSKHGGRVPVDRDRLLQLPGVGEYTAAAVRCFAFGKREPIVDTNVVRIFTRYFGIRVRSSETLVEKVSTLAQLSLPRHGVREFNWALLDYAAIVCKKRNPRCPVCPLKNACASYRAHCYREAKIGK